MSEQTHQSDTSILNRRSLARSHRRLAALLKPGMSVLDAGCGTGTITAGIAEAVGPGGRVVGADRDESLLAIARADHAGWPNVSFERADILELPYRHEYDVVSAARTVQWVADPARAIAQICGAAKPGGLVVVLDYIHEDNAWEPEPPAEFMRFYNAFLEWRRANGWDNRMGEHLPDLFRLAGVEGVQLHVDDETAQRGDADFELDAALWLIVMQKLGPQIDPHGFPGAEEAYRVYVRDTLEKQVLCIRTAVGSTSEYLSGPGTPSPAR